MLTKTTLLFLLIFSNTLYAQVLRGPITKSVYKNTNCSLSDSCDLKKIHLLTNDYEVRFSDGKKSYGSRMFLMYETDEIQNLKNYIVVQFIKGCQFFSTLKDNQVFYNHNISKVSFGEDISFKFPNWITDSVDLDPVYSSQAENNLPRHFGYRWNTVRGSFDQETQKYLKYKGPTHPEIYIRDMPGTAFYDPKDEIGPEMAKNISLEFKVCLYKEKDIPFVSTRDDLLQEMTPIKCFNWNSSFIFDHQKKKFEKMKSIHPVCLN